VSREFRKAFGLDIVVNRNAGSLVPILVGEKPVPSEGQDRLSFAYTLELEKLPSIESQGDGMRSYLGVLLYAMTGNESVLLIDEPEAFLHPPQARHLGAVLTRDSHQIRQLILATHSGDVLRGALESENPNVRVIRIRRASKVNVVRELSSSRIAEVWSDPLLRYSNILDGLFHERVVLCESDADCRFYSAITDVMAETSETDQRKPDVLFTHCGGKGRLPLVMRALKELEVPMSVVADFDVLNDEHLLRNIVEAAGGSWERVSANWREVRNGIEAKKPELSTDEVRKDIEKVLASATGTFFSASAKRQIQAILRRSSPWAIAKTVGISFVPSGQPMQACIRLFDLLETLGIFIVPVGELEGFVRSVGDHGPGWVAGVLKMDLANNPELEAAKQFVPRVLAGKKES